MRRRHIQTLILAAMLTFVSTAEWARAQVSETQIESAIEWVNRVRASRQHTAPSRINTHVSQTRKPSVAARASPSVARRPLPAAAPAKKPPQETANVHAETRSSKPATQMPAPSDDIRRQIHRERASQPKIPPQETAKAPPKSPKTPPQETAKRPEWNYDDFLKQWKAAHEARPQKITPQETANVPPESPKIPPQEAAKGPAQSRPSEPATQMPAPNESAKRLPTPNSCSGGAGALGCNRGRAAAEPSERPSELGHAVQQRTNELTDISRDVNENIRRQIHREQASQPKIPPQETAKRPEWYDDFLKQWKDAQKQWKAAHEARLQKEVLDKRAIDAAVPRPEPVHLPPLTAKDFKMDSNQKPTSGQQKGIVPQNAEACPENSPCTSAKSTGPSTPPQQTPYASRPSQTASGNAGVGTTAPSQRTSFTNATPNYAALVASTIGQWLSAFTPSDESLLEMTLPAPVQPSLDLDPSDYLSDPWLQDLKSQQAIPTSAGPAWETRTPDAGPNGPLIRPFDLDCPSPVEAGPYFDPDCFHYVGGSNEVDGHWVRSGTFDGPTPGDAHDPNDPTDPMYVGQPVFRPPPPPQRPQFSPPWLE
jgi:hypothetical protein